LEKKYFSNLGFEFKVVVNNNMGFLRHGSIFNPEKKDMYTRINTFLFGGCFWTF